MAVESLMENSKQKQRLRKLVLAVVLGVVGLHVAVGVVAGALVVARYLLPPPATFEVIRDVRLPAREREHRMNMDAFDAMTPKPSFNDKMQSMQPAEFALPELPNLPLDQMLPLDPSAIVSDQVSSMVGTAGLGAGGEGQGGSGGSGSGVSFLGIETKAKRILLLYDVSTTVTRAVARAGMSMERVRDETKKVLEGLSINTRFGMGQFARNYAFFQAELLPATDANRELANGWLDAHFTTSGSMPSGTPNLITGSPGFIELMRAAFKMRPDVVIVISDGGFYAGSGNDGGYGGGKIPYTDIDRAIGGLQKEADEPVQINFVGVGMKPDDARGMRRIISKHGNGGKFREIQ